MKDTRADALYMRYKASGNLSTVALVWLFSALISYLITLTNAKSSLIGIVLFIATLAVFPLTYSAFKSENKAEFYEYDRRNGMLNALCILVWLCFIVTLLAFFLTSIFKMIVDGQTDPVTIEKANYVKSKLGYIADLLSNVFSNLNLAGLFAIKIYLDEDKDIKLRRFSFASALLVGFHLLCAVVKYLILYFSAANSGSKFFDALTLILVYLSYFSIFFLFESRKNIIKSELKLIEDGNK